MLVKFKRNWFSPDAQRYRKSDGWQEVPDHLEEFLPKDVVKKEPEPVEAPSKKSKSLDL